jgi:hypothetical protein
MMAAQPPLAECSKRFFTRTIRISRRCSTSPHRRASGQCHVHLATRWRLSRDPSHSAQSTFCPTPRTPLYARFSARTDCIRVLLVDSVQQAVDLVSGLDSVILDHEHTRSALLRRGRASRSMLPLCRCSKELCRCSKELWRCSKELWRCSKELWRCSKELWLSTFDGPSRVSMYRSPVHLARSLDHSCADPRAGASKK